MVSELLHNNHENSFWTTWQTSFGVLSCFCCILFLGLKLKWFRAQLKLGDASNQNKSSPVQGIGFKLKSNPDDFQLYKVTSEFATPINQKQNNQNIENVENKKPPVTIRPVTNKPQISIQNISKTKLVSNSSTSSTVDTRIQEKVSDNMKNKVVLESSKTKIIKPEDKVTELEKIEVKKSEVLKQEVTSPKNNKSKEENIPQKNLKKQVDFDPIPIEITNPNAIKFSDLINKQKNEPKNEYEAGINKKQELIETGKQSIQIKNPLANQNFVMPSEDDWKIKIVDEKPKARIEENNLYFTGSSSNMYSSQAASIFFGGQPSEIQPRPRKFVEMEEDNISTGSQTSA